MTDTCPRCGVSRPGDVGPCPQCSANDRAAMPVSLVDLTLKGAPDSLLVLLPESPGVLPAGGPRADASLVAHHWSPEMLLPLDWSSRVQILGEIGRGGMGAVLKGHDPGLGRDIAVKVLLENHCHDPDLARRFVEEAQIAGQLQHPGVVPVYDMGTFGDARPYFIMKLVKGRTLTELLADRPAPADDRLKFLAMFLQVVQTIAYAHDRGVIHRDLKPSNVMVGSFGEVQVMDWGLAKILSRSRATADADVRGSGDAHVPANPLADSHAHAVQDIAAHGTIIATARSADDSDHSRAGSILGTPSYMPPEQARGEVDRIDRRADVFSLGAILCEILTGKPPYHGGGGSSEVLRKAALGDLTEAFARLRSLEADADLIQLTTDCLAPEPEDRPLDAQHIVDRLLDHRNSLDRRLREAELAQAAEHARAEEAKRTALAEAARAEAAEARTRAERQARRLQLGLAASILGLMALGAGGYTWTLQQRAQQIARTARTVDEAIADASRYRGEAQSAPAGDLNRWDQALNAAKRAADALKQGEADAPLRDRVTWLLSQIHHNRTDAVEKARTLKTDHELLATLESIRGSHSDHWDPRRTDDEYTEAFHKAEIAIDKTDPAEVGRGLAARFEPEELVGYLDDWAKSRRNAARPEADWRRLVAVAMAADPDPWRQALRDKLGKKDLVALAEFRRLADDETTLDLQPAANLVLLAIQLKNIANDREQAAQTLRRAVSNYLQPTASLVPLTALLKNSASDRDRAIRVLRRAVSNHPDDFWSHFYLSLTLRGDSGSPNDALPRLEESVRHLTAAIAIRPENFMAHSNLAHALQAQGKLEEAISEFRQALRIQPEFSSAHTGLGGMLLNQGKLEEAASEFRQALRINPESGQVHINLGVALQRQGKLEEAVAEYHHAEVLAALADRLPNLLAGKKEPKDPAEGLAFAQICHEMKRNAAATRYWARALATDPNLATIAKSSTAITRPAPQPWPALARARTSRPRLNPLPSSSGDRPSTGSTPSWSHGPRSLNLVRPRPERRSSRPSSAGGRTPTSPASAIRRRSRGFRRASGRPGGRSGRAWKPSSKRRKRAASARIIQPRRGHGSLTDFTNRVQVPSVAENIPNSRGQREKGGLEGGRFHELISGAEPSTEGSHRLIRVTEVDDRAWREVRELGSSWRRRGW